MAKDASAECAQVFSRSFIEAYEVRENKEEVQGCIHSLVSELG